MQENVLFILCLCCSTCIFSKTQQRKLVACTCHVQNTLHPCRRDSTHSALQSWRRRECQWQLSYLLKRMLSADRTKKMYKIHHVFVSIYALGLISNVHALPRRMNPTVHVPFVRTLIIMIIKKVINAKVLWDSSLMVDFTDRREAQRWGGKQRAKCVLHAFILKVAGFVISTAVAHKAPNKHLKRF